MTSTNPRCRQRPVSTPRLPAAKAPGGAQTTVGATIKNCRRAPSHGYVSRICEAGTCTNGHLARHGGRAGRTCRRSRPRPQNESGSNRPSSMPGPKAGSLRPRSRLSWAQPVRPHAVGYSTPVRRAGTVTPRYAQRARQPASRHCWPCRRRRRATRGRVGVRADAAVTQQGHRRLNGFTT